MKLLSTQVTMLLVASFLSVSDAGRGSATTDSFDPRMMDTDEPTFAPVMNAGTRQPQPSIGVSNTPGSSASYEFTTSGGTVPTLNAQTEEPIDVRNTFGPTSSPTFTTALPTFAPTMYPTYQPTSSPTDYPTPSPSAWPTTKQPGTWYTFSTGPVTAPTLLGPTLDAQTTAPINGTGDGLDDCMNSTDAWMGNHTDMGGNYTDTSSPTMTYVPISYTETSPPSKAPIASSLMPTNMPMARQTDGPTVTPGSPSATPTTAAPSTSSSPTGAPTTAGPTVTPGSPSATPTTASPTSMMTDPPTNVDGMTNIDTTDSPNAAPTMDTMTTDPPNFEPTTTTAVPTESNPFPTASPSTEAPTGAPSGWPSMPPVLIVNAATSGPTINSDNVTLPTNSTGIESNVTEPACTLDGGSFLTTEAKENATVPFPLEVDILSFSYELETTPRTDVEEILPLLEAAFVNSILSVLFPFECGASGSVSRHMRFLELHTVVGVSSTPADEVNPNVECEAKDGEKQVNQCVVVDGKITIYSLDGASEALFDEVSESLEDSMENGDFVDPDLGIVRVSYITGEIEDEGVTQVEDNVMNDGNPSDVVRPVDDQGSMLGVGLSLSAASVILILVGASVYRRKKGLSSNDGSSFQEGATINGLSRFDVTVDPDSMRDVEVMPLSPAARNYSEHRYTSDATSLTF